MILIHDMILSIVYLCNAPYATSGVNVADDSSIIVPANVSVYGPVDNDTFLVEKGGKMHITHALCLLRSVRITTFE